MAGKLSGKCAFGFGDLEIRGTLTVKDEIIMGSQTVLTTLSNGIVLLDNVNGPDGELTNGLTYVDRGDFNTFDFSTEDFIIDDVFHELDLSGIVPEVAASHLVYLNIRLDNSTVAAWVRFSENGYVNDANSEMIRVILANLSIYSPAWIKMDANRKIQYKVKNVGTWRKINVVVRGWWE